MPLGIKQSNNLTKLTVDVWDDKIFFNEKEYLAGYFATEVLNRSPEQNDDLLGIGGTIMKHLMLLKQSGMIEPQLKQWINLFFDQLKSILPFSLIDFSGEREMLDLFFTDGFWQEVLEAEPGADDLVIDTLRNFPRIAQGIVNYGTFAINFEHFFLKRLRKRNETHFAAALNDFFNETDFMEALREFELTPEESFSPSPRMEMSYVFARHPKREEETVFVSRVSFRRVVDFYTFDFMNGLHHGHSSCRCENCGRYFLVTSGHMPKYCDGIAPQGNGLTCRQVGAKMHQKEKNTEHPVYRLFKTRSNTIRKHHERGKINDEIRSEALRLAEAYRDRALIDDTYASDGYANDMELDNLYAAARKRLNKNAVC